MRAILTLILCSTIFGQNPQFRQWDLKNSFNLPLDWSKTNHLIWSCYIPGNGSSSPVVDLYGVYVTTSIEIPSTNIISNDSSYCKLTSNYQSRQLIKINRMSGTLVWKTELYCDMPDQKIHPKNTFASETPIADGERIYAYFGNVGLFCVNTKGKLLWTYKVKSTKVWFDWGKSASPYLYKDKIILVDDNREQSYIVLLDAKTGNVIWKKDRTENVGCWSTPIVWENSKRTEIIVSASGKHSNNMVRSYSLDGKELWSWGDLTPSSICQPITYGDMLYICSGHNTQKYRPIFAFKAGLLGNQLAWKNDTNSPHVPTPIVYKDRMYIVYDNGKFSCLNALNGKVMYTTKLASEIFSSSVWTYRGKIFCLDESGNTYVINPGDVFSMSHTNTIPDYTITTPAISDNYMFIRGKNTLYCIGIPQ